MLYLWIQSFFSLFVSLCFNDSKCSTVIFQPMPETSRVVLVAVGHAMGCAGGKRGDDWSARESERASATLIPWLPLMKNIRSYFVYTYTRSCWILSYKQLCVFKRFFCADGWLNMVDALIVLPFCRFRTSLEPRVHLSHARAITHGCCGSGSTFPFLFLRLLAWDALKRLTQHLLLLFLKYQLYA